MKKPSDLLFFIALVFALASCTRRTRIRNVATDFIVSDRTARIHGEYATNQYERATFFIREGDWNKARRCLLNADSADPQNPDILTDLGNAVGETGGGNSSYHYFDQAINLDSTLVRAYVNYGYWLNYNGKYRDAIRVLAKGIHQSNRRTKERHLLYVNLAGSYHELGRDSLALRALDLAKQGLENGPILDKILLAEFSYRLPNRSHDFRNAVTRQDSIGIREIEYRQLKNTDELGELKTIIDFKIRTKNLKDYPDGYVPSISINHFEDEVDNLVGKDDEPGPFYFVENLFISYDYPLKNHCIKCTHFNRSITKKVLIEAIAKNYREIYAEEEQTATIKAIPVAKRSDPKKRNETNGKYGIWGHDLNNLRLVESTVFIRKDSSVLLTVKVEN